MKQEFNEDHLLEDENKKTNIVGVSLVMGFGMLALLVFLILSLTSCTLSFTNVMTDGTASDVVDSDPHTDAKVDSKLTVPLKAL